MIHRLLSFREKNDILFLKLLGASFVVLLFYRVFLQLPIWFDEVFAKAFIFGAPLWIFAYLSKEHPRALGFEKNRFWQGAFSGLAVGGCFGFIAMLASSAKKGSIFIPYIFSSDQFWLEFGLAFATAWWESLFFYGFVLGFLQKKFKNEWQASLATTLIFVVFHAPILLLRGGVQNSIIPLFLLSLFAFGQAVIFLRTKSISSAVVSHAFWGMALLVYGV